jgi:hypothetical protein
MSPKSPLRGSKVEMKYLRRAVVARGKMAPPFKPRINVTVSRSFQFK